MGLEMLQLQSKLLERLKPGTADSTAGAEVDVETNRRLRWGFAAMFLYLLVGAAVFAGIEAPREQIELDAYNEYRTEWTRRLVRRGLSEEEIDNLFAAIRDSALNGIWREKNVTSESNWSFGHAFFFAAALISTVGYGHVSPRTPHGKLFTICYCVAGIPLALALISALAIRLRTPSVWLRTRINAHYAHVLHSHHLQLAHVAVLSGAILLFAFVIPSMFFSAIEDDWSFLDAFYFCFVSLTTIGLGDQVPGDKPDQPLRGFYKMVVAAYIIFGLCCMMLLLSTLYTLPQFNLVRLFVVKSPSSTALNGADNQGGMKGANSVLEGKRTERINEVISAYTQQQPQQQNDGGSSPRYMAVDGLNSYAEWPTMPPVLPTSSTRYLTSMANTDGAFNFQQQPAATLPGNFSTTTAAQPGSYQQYYHTSQQYYQ